MENVRAAINVLTIGLGYQRNAGVAFTFNDNTQEEGTRQADRDHKLCTNKEGLC